MRVSPCPLPSVVASSSYTVSAEGYPDYTANAITSDEAAAAYREAAAGDAEANHTDEDFLNALEILSLIHISEPTRP